MRFFLISDNSDAMNGMRLAGIEGVVARNEADLRAALDKAMNSEDIGMILVTEKISDAYQEILDEVRGGDQTGTLLVTVPSTGGSAAGKDRITRYVREAIGVKI